MIALTWNWICDGGSGRADQVILSALKAGKGQWIALTAHETIPANFSRAQIQRWIESGYLVSDGKAIRCNSKIRPGLRIHVQLPPAEPLEVLPEDHPIPVLYEDTYFLIVNKPPQMSVHPTATQTTQTLVNALLYQTRGLSGIGGKLRPGIVHRLDKNTSGALVISKTDEAHQKLALLFSSHDIVREYWAICFGTLPRKELCFESPIGRNPSDRKKMSMKVKHGKKAVSNFTLLERYGGKELFASLIQARLETGRTHQIRVHLTGLGCSLLGDPTYGTPTEKQKKWLLLPPDVKEAVAHLPGQALHARTLGFKHPFTGKTILTEATPPEGFTRLLEVLRPHRNPQ